MSISLSSLLTAETYDRHAAESWFKDNTSILFQAMLIYLVFVFVARHLLKDKKGFRLHTPLAIWNACLAIFSAIGFCKMLPAFFTAFQNHGWTGKTC